MEKIKLYCLPYAGGSAGTFKKWNALMNPKIEFKAIDYAGHGNRDTEEFYQNIQECCEDVYNIIKKDYEPGTSYYLMGHCMGAILCYELCYQIEKKQEIEKPKGIIVSGHGSPDKIVNEQLSDMSKDDLTAYLYEKGAIAPEMLLDEMRDLVHDFILPPVIADSELYESYQIKEERQPLSEKIVVMYGKNDYKFSASDVKEWDRFSKEEVTYIEYDGGHYFINDLRQECAKDINEIILS